MYIEACQHCSIRSKRIHPPALPRWDLSIGSPCSAEDQNKNLDKEAVDLHNRSYCAENPETIILLDLK